MLKTYKAIATEIAKIQAIKHIDWDNDQLNRIEIENAFETPAVFIGIDISYEQKAKGRQSGLATISVKIVIHQYSESHISANQINRHLEEMSIIDDVHLSLQNLKNDNVNSLQRISTKRESNEMGYISFTHTYLCGVFS